MPWPTDYAAALDASSDSGVDRLSVGFDLRVVMPAY